MDQWIKALQFGPEDFHFQPISGLAGLKNLTSF